MPIYKTILRRKEEVADGTMAFHFEKPGGFIFKAGQFGDFTLIDPIETDADRVPEPLGANFTVSVQERPGASAVPALHPRSE